ncbi:hypothetical protein L9F63_022413, partial [Diploptera punctata]
LGAEMGTLIFNFTPTLLQLLSFSSIHSRIQFVCNVINLKYFWLSFILVSLMFLSFIFLMYCQYPMERLYHRDSVLRALFVKTGCTMRSVSIKFEHFIDRHQIVFAFVATNIFMMANSMITHRICSPNFFQKSTNKMVASFCSRVRRKVE